MSNISVDYDVLNQKGSPAWFTDTFANLPTAGFKGRMFISTDTFAFYRDTGTGWDLIGGPGTGTLTGSGVSGQVSFFNGTQTITGNNNLFWNNTNSRLGINTATPGAPLDIHGTGTLIQVNGTGVGNGLIAYQQAGASKWTAGNFFDGTLNTFAIYNVGLVTNALTISSTSNDITITGNVNNAGKVITTGGIVSNTLLMVQNTGSVTGTNGFSSFSGNPANNGFTFAPNNSSYHRFITPTTGNYDYTFPATTGTIALTSNIPSLAGYVPYTGATTNVNIGANSFTTTALITSNQVYIDSQNTGTIGLDVASNTTRFRSDNLEGFKRQLEITMSSGTVVNITAKGYLANYGTDMAFYTATTGGTNGTPAMYITGTNNRIGIKTGTPAFDLDVAGTGNFSDVLKVSAATGFSVGSIAGYRRIEYTGTTFSFLTNADGFAGINAGQIGIGRSSPNAPLDVVSSTGSSSQLQQWTYKDGLGSYFLQFNTLVSGGLVQYSFDLTNNSVPYNNMMVFDRGNIGMGITAPAYRLQLGQDSAAKPTSALWTIASDERIKENINIYDKGLQELLQINPITYDYNGLGGFKKGKGGVGIIAQQIINILPDSVSSIKAKLYEDDENLTDILNFNGHELIYVLINSIKELNEKLVKNNIN